MFLGFGLSISFFYVVVNFSGFIEIGVFIGRLITIQLEIFHLWSCVITAPHYCPKILPKYAETSSVCYKTISPIINNKTSATFCRPAIWLTYDWNALAFGLSDSSSVLYSSPSFSARAFGAQKVLKVARNILQTIIKVTLVILACTCLICYTGPESWAWTG